MTKAEKEKRYIEVEKERKALLALMLKKANLTYDDIVEAALDTWMVQNIDLITDKEKQRFKHLVFYDAKGK